MLLINFSFENFRSFREAQQFSMERFGRKAPSETDGAWERPDLSTVAAFYGPNASGKSNFIAALSCLSRLVRDGYSRGVGGASLPCEPYLLGRDGEGSPVSFLADFVADDGVRYVYELSVSGNEVSYEALRAYYTNRPSVLFERDAKREHPVKFGKYFSGPKAQLWEIVRPGSLLLSAAEATGNESTQAAFSALSSGIGAYDASCYESELSNLKRSALRGDRTLVPRLSELVRYADFGIKGIAVRRADDPPDVDVDAVLGALGLDGESEEDRSALTDDLRTVWANDVFFLHGGDGGDVWFPSSRESDGTIAALSFFSVALRTLGSGGLILVDEIDRSLHPMLVKDFVDLFLDERTNPRQAQLVFTTHDVSLMMSAGSFDRLLDRDQVWLVQKNGEGESELVPATDYGVRAGENMGRNYLNGVYRALPHPCFHEAVARLVPEGGGNGR